MIRKIISHPITNKSVPLCHSCMRQSSPIGAECLFGSGFSASLRSLAAGLPNPFYPAEELRGAKHLFWIGRLNCVSLVCRLPANSRAGTFKRCRRRISGTYRTYGTYRTKVDRMANSFSADLLWCGFRPPVQRKKNLRITPHPRPICPV